MITTRQLALLKWVYNEYQVQKMRELPNLIIQKFLFFYECFSKVENDIYSFDGLKGYVNGPVFSEVYGAIRYHKAELNREIAQEIDYEVNVARATKAFFITRSLGNELSDFTHDLNIWRSQEPYIKRGYQQIELYDRDFSREDARMCRELLSLYTLDYIQQVKLIEYNGRVFIIDKDEEIKEEYYDVFFEIANDKTFKNPIYVDIHEGELYFE